MQPLSEKENLFSISAAWAALSRFSGAGRFGSEQGQSLVEYVLILSLVSIVVVAALGLLGTAVVDLVDSVVDLFS
jgi:Flp pilus assembly pilin Flp